MSYKWCAALVPMMGHVGFVASMELRGWWLKVGKKVALVLVVVE